MPFDLIVSTPYSGDRHLPHRARDRPRLRPLNPPLECERERLSVIIFLFARIAPVEGRSRDTLGMCGFEPT
eukprot:CAMPEP_0197506180 /NCGR_PEP_ID=MMETSP1312-20131121/5396_1 /TAXON_ID=464262 /ORGANISM="Genus nov. species nov., Strain RCC2335" /LENGTH=70 /DNA_ID=CAMNT_0043053341 /DNA_START=28 /DNA_END=240 /DNA_ORIENTATION=+